MAGFGCRPRQSDGGQSLVLYAPPCIDHGAASDVGVEAARALCLLRASGERLEPDDVRLPRRAHLAQVAQPSVVAEVDAVEAVSPPPRAVSASADDGRPLRHRRVAKPSAEEPDAAEPARPDLWGAGVSNDPGLPDRGIGPCVAEPRSRWGPDYARHLAGFWAFSRCGRSRPAPPAGASIGLRLAVLERGGCAEQSRLMKEAR